MTMSDYVFPGTLALLLGLTAACGPSAQRSADSPGSTPPAASAPAVETGHAPAERHSQPDPAPAEAPGTAVPDFVRRAVDAEDRSAEDRALDAGRKPAELLAFFGIAPGMRVAELGAGGGYTAELVARVVGPTGKVYGQNSRFLLERFAEKPWSERLKKPVMNNVVRSDREFDDPLPPEAKELDAVLLILFYHDTVWQKTDRKRMNENVFAALRPGGVFGVVDHSARVGAGLSETETLHRIEESVVRDEIERAGFVLDGEASFLREPKDARDWNASPRKAGARRGASDRFVLRFKKPAQ